ncbi:late histone H2B.L4-like [Hyposmocoma kahamanoa]|uniref:late histone H2B.L4-like n=1 Tax=Hyposmocoma kahamanoa TaxID=1477025 RepID=UPI000E6D6442|nr:late histone H2B.L4-like [Hyposmocoma kahamanoa]
MAPKVPSKKPVKTVEKPIEKIIAKKSKDKKKKKNYHNFSIYIYKILKQTSENKMGISRSSMMIMNNFVYDMMEKIANEAGRLAAFSKKHTLTSREVQTAIKLLIPGELAKHANIEALKAITMYHNSRDKQ